MNASSSNRRLTERCGKHFAYRDFIQCGDTWRTRDRPGASILNLPQQPGTWMTMRALCKDILDPVWDKFGCVTLTYAFASTDLDVAVRERARAEGRLPNTTRNGDQHAGCELNSKGMPICKRLGLAVDFRIDGVSSGEIADWIVKTVPFDRLYYYGDERPVHVSVGPENSFYRWNRYKP